MYQCIIYHGMMATTVSRKLMRSVIEWWPLHLKGLAVKLLLPWTSRIYHWDWCVWSWDISVDLLLLRPQWVRDLAAVTAPVHLLRFILRWASVGADSFLEHHFRFSVLSGWIVDSREGVKLPNCNSRLGCRVQRKIWQGRSWSKTRPPNPRWLDLPQGIWCTMTMVWGHSWTSRVGPCWRAWLMS